MKTIKDYRKESIMQKKMRFAEGIMTRKEWLDLMRVRGAYVKEGTKNRIEFNRIKYNRMGNYTEQQEYEKKCNEKVPSYQLYEKGVKNTFFEISKTEFEYFQNSQLSEDILTEKYDLSERIEAGLATEEEMQEDMNNEMEFFAKYFHD